MLFALLFSFFYLVSSKVLNQIGRLYLENVNAEAVESVDLDPITNKIFAANGDQVGVNVISLKLNNNLTSANMELIKIIDLSIVTLNNKNVSIKAVTSVKVIPNTNIISAVLSPLNTAINEGYLVLINTQSLFIINIIQLNNCYLPDMITSTSNGNLLFIACEGEPSNLNNDMPNANPEGAVQIIDVGNIHNIKQYNINFNQFDNVLLGNNTFGVGHSSIYIPYKSSTFSINAEPEYIAISDDDKYAYITLQENNAVAIIDIPTKKIIDIFGLGFQSYSKFNKIDASDKDGKINTQNYPNLYGLKQPDSIVAFNKNGKYYFAIANEGDSKEFDESRVKSLILDEYSFKGYNISELQKDDNLGRLKVLNTEGYRINENGDKVFNKLYTFSSRNFEIYQYVPPKWYRKYGKSYIKKVYSSRDEFEKITAQYLGTLGFNNNGDSRTFDARSDDKGPEPEGIAYIKCSLPSHSKWKWFKTEKEYILTGLERTGGIMVYKLIMGAYHKRSKFVEYEINRNFSVLYEGLRPPKNAGDVSPEQLTVIKEDIYGKPLVIVSNTISSSVTVYRVDCGGEKKGRY